MPGSAGCRGSTARASSASTTAGCTKLVGTGQRVTRRGYLFSAVIMVHGADRARAALAASYPLMGLELRPETVGCVADAVPGVTVEDVRAEVLAGVTALF